jgi:hypothetical protein
MTNAVLEPTRRTCKKRWKKSSTTVADKKECAIFASLSKNGGVNGFQRIN